MAIQTDSRQEYQQKVKAKLDKLNAQIDEYRAKAEQMRADATIHYHDRLEELTAQREAVQLKLDELGSASEAAWDDIRQGFEAAWERLATTFNMADSEAKQTQQSSNQK